MWIAHISVILLFCCRDTLIIIIMVMMMQNLIKSLKDNALFFYIYFLIYWGSLLTLQEQTVYIFCKWAGKFITKCIPVVGTLNTLWFQKGSKCYEHLGKHQTETRRKGVCYKNITDCWDMVIDQNLACPVEPGLGGFSCMLFSGRAQIWQLFV